MERSRCRSPSTPTARFTERQGQYLAFIHAYTKWRTLSYHWRRGEFLSRFSGSLTITQPRW